MPNCHPTTAPTNHPPAHSPPSIDADVYDGHRKRALPEGIDIERSVRLGLLCEVRLEESKSL